MFLSPPVRIRDVRNGIYDKSNKQIEMIYGDYKRVMIVATIMKKYFVDAETNENTNINRASFTLDDGTGEIRATWFRIDQETINTFGVGDIIATLARIGSYDNEINLTIDQAYKVFDFNEELHHRSMILTKLHQLVKEGKPLELEDGGRITNLDDDVAQYFINESEIYDEGQELEEPINFDHDNSEEMKFELSNSLEGDDNDEIEASAFSGEEPLDDDILKETIIQTLIELDTEDGVYIDELVKAIGYDKNIVKKYLQIMENEKIIKQTSQDTYRPY